MAAKFRQEFSIFVETRINATNYNLIDIRAYSPLLSETQIGVCRRE